MVFHVRKRLLGQSYQVRRARKQFANANAMSESQQQEKNMECDSTSLIKEKTTSLFLTHRDYVKGVALRYVVFPHLADDVVQQVYIKFLNGAENWDLDGNVKMLLGVMSRNIAKALWKSESRHQPARLQEIADQISRIAEEENWEEHYSEDLKALEVCMNTVSPETRGIIDLRFFQGLSFERIAALTERKTDTVYRAVFRIMKKLRSCIERLRNKENVKWSQPVASRKKCC